MAQQKHPHNKPSGFVSRFAPTAVPGARSVPATLDEATRSCEFVLTTEDPVEVWDWDLWDVVDEVLRMDGVVLPAIGQCPMLDSHMRYSQADQLGSFRNFAVAPEKGESSAHMTGRGYFSTVLAADEAFTKVREGHLTDVSVGYRVVSSVFIESGTKATVAGREYTGPLRVVTKWELLEVSICPIGADPAAKARASGKQINTEEPMAAEKKKKKAGKRADAPGENELEIIPTPEDGEEEQPGTVAEIVADAVGQKVGDELPGLVADAVAEALAEKPAEGGEGGEGEDEEAAEETRKKAILAERKRIDEIDSICARFNVDKQTRDSFVKSGARTDAVRKSVMERMEMRGGGASFRAGMDERDKVRAAALDGLLLRCGIRLEKPAAGSENFRGMMMREMAREFLTRAGFSASGDVMAMMGRALTTTDMPLLLTEGMNRMLMSGWEKAQKTWDIWADVGEAQDFRQSMAIGIDFDQALKRVPENGEYTYSYSSENGEAFRLATYGRIFPITRQALINDDLGAFTRIAIAQGEAASNTINKLAYAVLGKNPKMRDGAPLFSTGRGNVVAGGGTPTVASLEEAETTIGLQKDSYGNPLRIVPEFYIAPWSLRASSESFFKNEYIGTSAQPLVRNTYFDSYTRVYDPDLDRYSNDDWYLLGPKGKTVTVFFLNGQQSPTLEERQGWTVDGVEYKVRIDATAAAVSALAMAKSTENPDAPTPEFPDEFSPVSGARTGA